MLGGELNKRLLVDVIVWVEADLSRARMRCKY